MRNAISELLAGQQHTSMAQQQQQQQQQADQDKDTRLKLWRSLAKCSRVPCLLAFFQASLFTACTAKLTRSGNNRSDATVSDSSNFERIANSPRLRRAFANYSLIVISFYAYCLIMSIVTALLDLNLFASYRYIDCYWLGRFAVNGRTSQPLKYVCLQLVFSALLIRLRNTFGGIDLYAQIIDFLHRDLAEIEHCVGRQDLTRHRMPKLTEGGEIASNNSQQQQQHDDDGYDIYYKRCEPTSRAAGKKSLEQCKGGSRDMENCGRINFDDVIFAKIDCQSFGELLILKLNRHPRNWRHVCIVALVAFTLGTAFITCCSGFMFIIMTPTITTKRGFELLYPNCIDYIRQYASGHQPASGANEFSFIYELPRRELSIELLPAKTKSNSNRKLIEAEAILAMEDFVSGHYHLLRIAIDYIMSLLLFVDFMSVLTAYACLQLPVYYDIIANAYEIYKRMVRLRTIKWQQLAADQACHGERMTVRRNLHVEPTWIKSANSDQKNSTCAHLSNYNPKLETLLLQALLLDHFAIVKQYSHFLSANSILGIIMWFNCSCTLLMCLGLSGSSSIYYEFYIAEICITACILYLLISVSAVTRINRKFYPLVASLMALDDERSFTKQCWKSIINYYHPTPIYSATIFAHEINFLLVVKLFAWAFSAMFVVLSFVHLGTNKTN